MASDLLAALPGAPVSVREALPTLAHAWAAEGDEVVRASQLNLVLLLGPGTSPAEAAALFEQAQGFARRYPSRLVVLAERAGAGAGAPPEAKVHVACFLDPARRGKRCCEALMLAHGPHSPELESLVSTWLEGDLPSYLWSHRMPASSLAPWAPFAGRLSRVVIDRSVDGDAPFAIAWPRPELVRDLAASRCLPVRQALGQFLSGHAPADLVRGLRTVRAVHGPEHRGEAHGLLAWMRGGLEACASLSGIALAADFVLDGACRKGSCLAVEWTYDNGNHFAWEHAEAGSSATVALDFATSHRAFDLSVPFSSPELALGEAVFF